MVTDAAKWEVDPERDAFGIRYGILWDAAGEGMDEVAFVFRRN